MRDHHRSLQNPKYPQYDDNAFDFNRLVPMPKELSTCAVGTMSKIADHLLADRGIGDFAGYQWIKDAGITTVEQLCAHRNYKYDEVAALGRLRQENREKYGFADWYEWRNHYWGTRSNPSCIHFCHKPQDKDTALVFDTAWAPPMPVTQKLFELFPTHEFRYSWWETTNNFGDQYTVRNGKIAESEKFKVRRRPDCEKNLHWQGKYSRRVLDLEATEVLLKTVSDSLATTFGEVGRRFSLSKRLTTTTAFGQGCAASTVKG